MKALGAEQSGIDIMASKGKFQVIKTSPISSPAANIIKQQMLSIGGECAVARGVANCSILKSPVILMGTCKHFNNLIEHLKYQYFGLPEIAGDIEEFFKHKQAVKIFRVGNREFYLNKRTLIMGILNVTPDSFSDGGKYSNFKQAVQAAINMEKEGADIIDVGGESSRPGADPVSLDEELNRVIPVIQEIRKATDIPISIDTYKSQVAEKALENGANLVNDISGLMFDPEMINTIAKYDASVAVMHIKGTPKNMQDNPGYENIVDEILLYLKTSIEKIKGQIGRNKILIDPGIGFGKQLKDNYLILRYLEEFKSLGYPILIGASRKSFIGNLLELSTDERLEGSIAAACCAVMNGADVLRIHDIKETVRAIKITDSIIGKS